MIDLTHTEEERDMAKRDMATMVEAADRLLETLTDPLHRQIIENYRRHALLEVVGRWEEIFAPDMTVEHPEYYLDIWGIDGQRFVGDEVKAFYKDLAETDTTTILVQDEKLMVADWGFASEAMFHTYLRGHHLESKGISGYDPDGFYIDRQEFLMIWPYDERGRMIGEKVHGNKSTREIVEVPEEDFNTNEDARERMEPLLRPLPVFDPESRTVSHA